MTTHGTPISMKALIRRINRALAKQEGCVHGEPLLLCCHGQGRCVPALKLRVARGARTRHLAGDFFLWEVAEGSVRETHVQPKVLGRHLGVLAAWEAVEATPELDCP